MISGNLLFSFLSAFSSLVNLYNIAVGVLGLILYVGVLWILGYIDTKLRFLFVISTILGAFWISFLRVFLCFAPLGIVQYVVLYWAIYCLSAGKKNLIVTGLLPVISLVYVGLCGYLVAMADPVNVNLEPQWISTTTELPTKWT